MSKEKNNHKVLRLVLLAVLLLSLAGTYLHWLVFIGLSPLFGLFELNKKGEISLGTLSFSVLITLLSSFFVWQVYDGIEDYKYFFELALHSILISLSFIIFSFTDRYAKNKIGFLTVIIYWVALEYVSLYVTGLNTLPFILGDTIFNLNDLNSRGLTTGILSISTWILTGNVLFYYVFFKDEAIFNSKVRWLSLLYSLILICLPLLIIYFIPIDQTLAETKETVDFEKEYFGRTFLWVTVLLVCYGFVKFKTQK